MKYMEAYIARRKNNHAVLMEVAKELKLHGCEVYSTKWRSEKQDGYRKYILAVKDGKRIYIGFNEVPYGWYANATCSAREELRFLDENHGYTFPYTIDEIMQRMQICHKGVDWFYERV